MHEAIGDHIKGEWMGSSPGLIDNGRSEQRHVVEERAALRQAVPIQLRADGRPYYVRLADIPQPWRDELRAALPGSGCPAIAGEGECAYASDWVDWLRGRFPRW